MLSSLLVELKKFQRLSEIAGKLQERTTMKEEKAAKNTEATFKLYFCSTSVFAYWVSDK